MATDVIDGEPRGLIGRVRAILLSPQSEWRRIADEEQAPVIGPYVVPLAIGGAVIGLGSSAAYTGFALGPALAWSAVAGALYVAFAIIGVIVASAVIGFLLRRFGGETDGWRAKQLAVYAATPVLVAAIGAAAPPVAAIVSAAGVVYALVLLAVGVPQLSPLPDSANNTPRFTLTFSVVAIGVAALAAAFIGPVINSGREALTGAIEAVAPAPEAPVIARRSAPELAIERLAQANATHVLVAPERLEEQFPDSLPSGFQRQSVATAQGGGVSRADGVYAKDDATLRVSVIQFSSRVDAAAFAALLAIKPDGQTADGYARTQSIDRRLFSEEVSGANARYVVIGRGVVMIAEGAATMDQARAAIETIDLQRLEAAFGR